MVLYALLFGASYRSWSPRRYTLHYYNMRGAAPSGARGGGERMRGAARFCFRFML